MSMSDLSECYVRRCGLRGGRWGGFVGETDTIVYNQLHKLLMLIRTIILKKSFNSHI